jgi:uncharacterized membrane protein
MNVNAPIALVGASYITLDGAVRDFTSVWGARHDGSFHHTSVAVLTKDGDGNLHVERSNSTAKHLEWGGALLGAALFVLAPTVGIKVLTGIGVSGAGAMVGHFHQHAAQEDIAEIASLLELGAAGLAVVALNRQGRAVTPLLTNANGRSSVDMPWGDLEEELSRDFVRSTSARFLVSS